MEEPENDANVENDFEEEKLKLADEFISIALSIRKCCERQGYPFLDLPGSERKFVEKFSFIIS